MNILEQQDFLKGLPDDRLMQMMQKPDGTVPQFLIGTELARRKNMRAAQETQNAEPPTTVAEDLTAPQDAGLGGVVRMANGRFPIGRVSPRYPNPNRVPPINMPPQFMVRRPVQLDPAMQEPPTSETSTDKMHFMRRLLEARTPPPISRPGPASVPYAPELGDIPFVDRKSMAKAAIAEGNYGTTADPLDAARIREWEIARREGPYTPPSSAAGYADPKIRAGRYGSIDGEQPQTTPVPGAGLPYSGELGSVPAGYEGMIARQNDAERLRAPRAAEEVERQQAALIPNAFPGAPPPELGVGGSSPYKVRPSIHSLGGKFNPRSAGYTPGVNAPDINNVSAINALDPTPLEVEKAIINARATQARATQARATQDNISVPKEGAPKKQNTQGNPPTKEEQKLAEDQAALLEAERKAIEGEPAAVKVDSESRADVVDRLKRQFASGPSENQRTDYFKGIEEKLAALQGGSDYDAGTALLRAGLAMAQAGGEGASTASAIGAGGLAGLDAYEKQKAASKADALKMLGIESEIAGARSSQDLANRKIGLQQLEIELDADRATRQLDLKGEELGINRRLVNAKVADLNKPDTYKWYMSLSPAQREIVNPILRKSSSSLADDIGKGAIDLLDNLEWRADFERSFKEKNKREPTMSDIITAARSDSASLFIGARSTVPKDPAVIMSKGK